MDPLLPAKYIRRASLCKYNAICYYIQATENLKCLLLILSACAGDGDTWFWKHKECRATEYFDMKTMSCQSGTCPGCLEEAPLYAVCEVNGEGSKFGHEDCTKVDFNCLILFLRLI